LKKITFSPLFWPVTFNRNTISVLDETMLPEKLVYIKVKNYEQACAVIKQMKTRAFGQVLLVFYTFLLVIRQNKIRQDRIPLLKKVANALNATRPTRPFEFLTDMILGWAAQDLLLETMILGFLEVLQSSRIQQARQVADFITDGETILTHCNISGLMPLIGQFCRQDDHRVSFFVTETRPHLQGVRLTAWELKDAGFEVVVVADSTAGHLMASGMIDKVIVGADHLARNGDIANKIGTLTLAIVAKHFNIPFYVLCPPASEAETGKDIKIEIRPENELLEFQGKRIAPAGVKGLSPGFDITPAHLITKHIYMEL
jgi:methylthioribose-1-phosphate isomerase